MLIALGPLSPHHLHGLLDLKFNLLEGFVFHVLFKSSCAAGLGAVCIIESLVKVKSTCICLPFQPDSSF